MEGMMGDSIFFNIPTDLVQYVLSYLITHDKLQLSLVSKCMKKDLVEKSHSFCIMDNKKIRYGTNAMFTVSQLQSIIDRFSQLRTLILYGLKDMSDSFLPIINTCSASSKFQHIELHDCCITRSKHILDLRNNQVLNKLSITGTIYSSHNLLLSICTSPKLSVLDLSGFADINDDNVHYIMESLKGNLLDLSLASDDIICPTIQSKILNRFNLEYCCKLKSLPSIGCPKLEYLRLSDCGSLRRASLTEIVKRCPTLKLICIHDCKKLHRSSWRQVDYLRTLDEAYSSRINDDQIYEIMQNAQRTLLDLSISSSHIHKPIIQSDKLSRLNLEHCEKLYDLPSLRCPKLTYLNLTSCRNIHSKNVHRIIESVKGSLIELHLSSPHIGQLVFQSEILTRLDLTYCDQLHDLDSLKCPRLQYLDLSYCASLEDRSLIEVLANNNSPNLSTIILRDCKQLHEPSFHECLRLKNLDVSHCQNLHKIEVSCPILKSLKMLGCTSLKSVELNVPKLENLDFNGCTSLTVAATANGDCPQKVLPMSKPPKWEYSEKQKQEKTVTT